MGIYRLGCYSVFRKLDPMRLAIQYERGNMEQLAVLCQVDLLNLNDDKMPADVVARSEMPGQRLLRNAIFPKDWQAFGRMMETYAENADCIVLSLHLEHGKCDLVIHPCTGLAPAENQEQGEGISFTLDEDRIEALHEATGKILAEMRRRTEAKQQGG